MAPEGTQAVAQGQAAPSASPAAPSATKVLLDQAQSQQAAGRTDLAVQSWQQVLLTEPGNAEALRNLARVSRASGDAKLADSYERALQAASQTAAKPTVAAPKASAASAKASAAPPAPWTPTPGQRQLLQQASKLADGGKYQAAMTLYRQVFGNRPPPGEWSVAYYEAEAATESGRSHAVEGLRGLVETYPGDPQYQIALGHVLTYNPLTRQEGRELLNKFPNEPKATQAVRQSLVWDAANPAAAPQIRAYLATHQDAQLAAVFQATQPHAVAASGSPAPATASAAAASPLSSKSKSTSAASSAAPAPSTTASVGTPPSTTAATPAAAPPAAAKPVAAVAAAALPAAHASGAQATPPPVLPTTAPTAQPVASQPAAKSASAAVSAPASPAPASPIAPPAVAASAPAPASAPPNVAPPRTKAAESAEEVAAYKALNANRIVEAESRFNAVLAIDPLDPKALAGMGYVRMQQGNFLGAVGYLEQAKRFGPENKALSAALDTARFFFIVSEGQTALQANDLATAEKRYRGALELRPESPEALEGLGETMLRAQQPGPAAALFEHAVQRQPESVQGWRGLVTAQIQGGNTALALATYKKIPAGPQGHLMTDPQFLEEIASAYSSAGRSPEAQAALETALKQSFPPESKGLKADIEVQLAALLTSSGQWDRATALYKQVLASDPASVAAWQGLVRVQHASSHDQDALQTFQTMPAPVSAAAMRDPGFELTIASIYQAQNKLDDAQRLLLKAMQQETDAGRSPSPALELQLAGIYAGRGIPQLAYPIYRQVVREHPERADGWAGLLAALHATGHDQEAADQIKLIPAAVLPQVLKDPGYVQTVSAVYAAVGKAPDARLPDATALHERAASTSGAAGNGSAADAEIKNAWLLFHGNDDAGLYRELMALGSRTDLTADQRRTIQTIWANWAARRADDASAAGNTKRALALLNAAAQAFPDNKEALKALASGYVQAGDPHQAVLIYKAQNMASVSAADYDTAVSAALGDGDLKDADTWLRYGLAAFPESPQVLTSAARFERAKGDTSKAMQYYRASLKAMPPAAQAAPPAVALPGAVPATPLGLPSVERPQALSILLAPGNSEAAPGSGGPVTPPYLPSLQSPKPQLPPYDGIVELLAPPASTPEDPSMPAVIASAQPGKTTEPVSPPPPATPPAVRLAVPAATTVQLGDNTPRPSVPQTDVTDVLPTARYSESAKAREAEASHAEVAAARAERVRHLKSDAAARTGQSHPPPEGPVSLTTQNADYRTPAPNALQVEQPATKPTAPPGGVPDTGAQQYPQPRTQPGTEPKILIARNRPEAKPAAAPATSAPATVATSTPDVPKPAAPATAVVPSASPASPVPHAPAVVAVVPPAQPPAPAAPAAPALPLPSPPTDAQLRAANLPPLGGIFEGQVPLPLTPRQQTQSELDSLEGSFSGWIGGTGIGRYRAGIAGLDRLYGVEAPAESSSVFSRAARLTVIAQPVFLTSGQIDSGAFSNGYLPYLGTRAANLLVGEQSSNGVGGELQLATRAIGLAVGFTPYEFLVHNFTARALWNVPGGHLSLFGERQPVKDSQLSYAGLYDPGSFLGQRPIWGGVIASGGGARVQFGGGYSTFFVEGQGGILTGEHVQNNLRVSGTAEAIFRVASSQRFGTLELGAALTAKHYQYNESGLSFGQGGYFSPDTYFLAAAPFSFTGHRGTKFHYQIAGSVGVQLFEQAEAPFFPLDPALQNTFVPSNGATCNPSQAPSYNCGEYPLTDTTSFNYAVNAESSYRFAQHWFAGAFAFANNSNNFDTVSAGFFLRYVFRAQHSPEGYPAGMFRIEGLRPLQIP